MENQKKPPVRVNQILKLPITKFGKEGDIIFMYKNFIIILKDKNRPAIRLHEFVKIRITKVLSNFALCELAK